MERVFPTGDDVADMSSLSRVIAAILLVVIVALVGVCPAAGDAPDSTAELTQQQDRFGEPPAVEFIVDLETDGDARWNITTTVSLETREEIEAYRETATEFTDGALPSLGFASFENGIAGVNGQTDREMTITGLTRETATESEIESGTGRFTVEFTWENFMQVDGSQLQIDSAVLVTESGRLWFPELGASQTLTFRVPENYGVRDASVNTQNGELRWEGPVEFDDTTLQATFVGPSSPPPDDGQPDQPAEENQSGLFPWIVLPIAALGIAVAVILSRSDQFRLTLPDNITATTRQSTGGTDTTEQPEPTEPDNESEAETDDDIDTELLSDEERVERLLSANGGRMKQADIVSETDWSNAKVSQLLSSMEEDGQIDKLRIGRENLISFPDEDVTDTEE